MAVTHRSRARSIQATVRLRDLLSMLDLVISSEAQGTGDERQLIPVSMDLEHFTDLLHAWCPRQSNEEATGGWGVL